MICLVCGSYGLCHIVHCHCSTEAAKNNTYINELDFCKTLFTKIDGWPDFALNNQAIS